MQEVSYQGNVEYDQSFTYKNEKIAYMSVKHFEKKNPKYEGGFKIIGAIGSGLKTEKGILHIKQAKLSFYAMDFRKITHEIKGYIEIEKGIYIAIVKSKYIRNAIVTLVFLTLLSGIYYFGINKDGIPIDSLANKYTPPIKLQENSDATHISIPGYSDIKVKADSDMAYVSLWNPDENPCYFVFTMIDRDSEEQLYQSKLIPPGYAVSEVKLNKVISKGIHPITIRISTYDVDDYKKQLNGGEVQANLVGVEDVEN